MRNRKNIVTILVLSLVVIMVFALVGCGPTKNPEDVKKFITKAIEKGSFTLSMTAEDEELYFKFDNGKCEMYLMDTLGFAEYTDKAVITYIQDKTDKKFVKVEEALPPDTDMDKAFDEAMQEALDDISNAELVYSEDIGGFVPAEVVDDPDNTAYMVLDKGVLSLYDGETKVGEIKDVGKTRVKMPAKESIKEAEVA